jgi:hypothetical protein
MRNGHAGNPALPLMQGNRHCLVEHFGADRRRHYQK